MQKHRFVFGNFCQNHCSDNTGLRDQHRINAGPVTNTGTLALTNASIAGVTVNAGTMVYQGPQTFSSINPACPTKACFSRTIPAVSVSMAMEEERPPFTTCPKGPLQILNDNSGIRELLLRTFLFENQGLLWKSAGNGDSGIAIGF